MYAILCLRFPSCSTQYCSESFIRALARAFVCQGVDRGGADCRRSVSCSQLSSVSVSGSAPLAFASSVDFPAFAYCLLEEECAHQRRLGQSCNEKSFRGIREPLLDLQLKAAAVAAHALSAKGDGRAAVEAIKRRLEVDKSGLQLQCCERGLDESLLTPAGFACRLRRKLLAGIHCGNNIVRSAIEEAMQRLFPGGFGNLTLRGHFLLRAYRAEFGADACLVRYFERILLRVRC